ncbi:MAG: 4-alpha-glucanotransferase [Bacteroidaceae bacterium]
MKSTITLHFSIEYVTSWGESICASVSVMSKTETVPFLVPLQTTNGKLWTASKKIEIDKQAYLSYRYGVVEQGIFVKQEMEQCPHTCNITEGIAYSFEDTWRDFHHRAFLYSTAFNACLFAMQPQPSTCAATNQSLHFLVQGLLLPKGKRLAIIGNCPQLGAWNVENAMLLNQISAYDYELWLNKSELPSSIEYKYIIISDASPEQIEWEKGDNRTLLFPQNEKRFILLRGDVVRRDDYQPHIAGTVIPLFSLRSKESYGVGDFADLKKMIDWLVATTMNLIQLLPINDTTRSGSWHDSYPYNSISVFAIHPMYISLKWLGKIKSKTKAEALEKERIKINALPQVDYELANALKFKYLHLFFEQEQNNVLKSKSYQTFFDINKKWLEPYAAFCCLRDKLHTANFRSWGKYANYSEVNLPHLLTDKEFHKEFDFYCFIQFVAFEQIQKVRAYARLNQVILKGDIPIGISRDSVPSWVDTQLFNFEMQAGAPPDDFSKDGQNWGFPTYNWEGMMKDGCQWWKNRLLKMSEYCDAYRIDHVLGFFRIWEIPYEQLNGTMGHFFPAKPFTQEELSTFDFHYRATDFTEPYLTDKTLSELFGELEQEAKLFLEKQEENLWSFKVDFNTQRKINLYFAPPLDEKSKKLRALLFHALGQVLFFADKADTYAFHPNIAGQKTTAYRVLTNSEKQAYNRLYDEYFYHRHNEFWQAEAMKKLPMLTNATKMLPCAEDLGMIPDGVAAVLHHLQILSLEVQRMPKRSGENFADTNQYHYKSVCTIATHDMAPLRKWWQEDEKRRSLFAKEVLALTLSPESQMSPQLCQIVVYKHLASPSMICALALQDWLSIDETVRCHNAMQEQINDPANAAQYWNYRMHLTLEELMACSSLTKTIRDMIKKTGRNN